MGEFSPLKNELIRLRKAGVQFTLHSDEFLYFKHNIDVKNTISVQKFNFYKNGYINKLVNKSHEINFSFCVQLDFFVVLFRI